MRIVPYQELIDAQNDPRLKELIDAMSEAAEAQERAYNEIQRLRTDHLIQAQRAAELQAEVDRLTDENQKLIRKLQKVRSTIRRMEEGEL